MQMTVTILSVLSNVKTDPNWRNYVGYFLKGQLSSINNHLANNREERAVKENGKECI